MALIGGLIGGTGGNIGSASVALLLNTSQFDSALARSQGKLTGAAAKMDAVGRKMSAVGGALTRGVSVPLALAGGAATKMALDFNKAFVQIQTLGGKTGVSIEKMKAQVLDLAEATGEDPQGLATALYTVSSAGKEAASQAMPILTQAAKGAAIGMGDVETITKVLTATTNAYGSENLSAAEAMNILTQATHDSSAEADEMAAALGPVIGIASQVGISFDQVAAALASATIQGVSTDRAATGLRFLMQSLAAPTAIASQKLQQYGFSAQDLQRLIAKEGLQGSLQTLADTFDLTSTRGQQAWKAVVGGARGAIIANTLVGDHAADAASEVENLGDVAGVTNKKFELWGQTITGKNAKALGSLKAAAIRLGTELIPIFQRVVGVVSGWIDAFNDLSPAMRENVVKWGLIAAALGPVLKIAGSLIQVLSRLGPMLKTLGGGSALGAIIPIAAIAAVALIPVALKEANDQAKQNTQTFNAMGDALHRGGDEAQRVKTFTEDLLNAKVTGGSSATKNMLNQLGIGLGAAAIAKYRRELDMMVRSQDFANASTETWTKSLVKNSQLSFNESQSVSRMIASFDKLGGTLSESDRQWIEAYARVGDYEGLIDRLEPKLNQLYKKEYGIKFHTDTKGVENFTRATQETRTKLAAAQSALRKYGGELNASQRKAVQAAEKEGDFGQALKIVQRAINQMNPGKAKKATDDIAKSAQRADKYLKELPKHMSAGAAELNGLQRDAQAAGRGMDAAGKKADDLSNKVDQIPEKKEVKVLAETAQAQSALNRFIQMNTGRTITINTALSGPGAGVGFGGGKQHGFEGTVSHPTFFLAGEAGVAEHVSITPSGSGNRKGHFQRPTFILNFNSPVMGSDVGAIVEKALTDRVLRRGALV